MARSCSSRRLNRRALSDVRLSDDGERESFVDQLAVREAPNQPLHRGIDRIDSAQDLLRGRDGDIVLCEIDACLKQRDQFQQLFLQWLNAARHRALDLLCGDTRLVERGGFDEVANSFRSRKIDPAIQVSAQGEFAGLRQTRAFANRTFHAKPEDNRRAVAANLDQVIGGIRAGCGEVGYDHVVHGLAVLVRQRGHERCPGSPLDSGTNRQDPAGDVASLRTRKPDYSDAAASGRGGNGDDGVAQIQ